MLRRAGLVEAHRKGLWIYYRVASPSDPTVGAILETTIAALAGDEQTLADRRRMQRRTPTVVKPQAWHGTDPDFLD